jgi:hypothetical protein
MLGWWSGLRLCDGLVENLFIVFLRGLFLGVGRRRLIRVLVPFRRRDFGFYFAIVGNRVLSSNMRCTSAFRRAAP